MTRTLHLDVNRGYEMKSTSIALMFLGLFLSQPSYAASVQCSFMSETQITTNGEWIKSEIDFMKLYDMFGDGLNMPLADTLLENLDTQQPFFAGVVDRGKVYLLGGDAGVEGKLIDVSGDTITIYDGFCSVGFG
jgi:hypothetical protein